MFYTYRILHLFTNYLWFSLSGADYGWELPEGSSERHLQLSRPEPLAEDQLQGLEHPDDPRERLLRLEDPEGDQPCRQQPLFFASTSFPGQRWTANATSRRQQHCQVTFPSSLIFQADRHLADDVARSTTMTSQVTAHVKRSTFAKFHPIPTFATDSLSG